MSRTRAALHVRTWLCGVTGVGVFMLMVIVVARQWPLGNRQRTPFDPGFSVVELPPGDHPADREASSEIFSVLSQTVLTQPVAEALPFLLGYHRVKYAILYDTAYRQALAPFCQRVTTVNPTLEIAEVDAGKTRDQLIRPIVVFGEGWSYGGGDNGAPFRWMMEESATVSLYVPAGEREDRLILTLTATPVQDRAALEITFHDVRLTTEELTVTDPDAYVELAGVTPGRHLIRFMARNGCKSTGAEEPRCFNFAFKALGLMRVAQLPDQGIVRFNGFFPAEGAPGAPLRWMGMNASLQVLSPQPRDAMVTFETASYATARTFTIGVNGRPLQDYIIPPGQVFRTLEVPLRLNAGSTRIALSVDSCGVPARVEASADQRCLGVAVKGVRVERAR